MTDSENDPYENDVEREWSEASSIRGVDPSMLDEHVKRRNERTERIVPAAFSPWLIPYAAITISPLIAALLALFANGDPPRPREAIAIVSTGAAAWAVNMGFTVSTIATLSPTVESAIRFGVLFAAGAALWAFYTYWMKGNFGLDRPALNRTIVILVVLSGLFWVGRDATWWAWMGR